MPTTARERDALFVVRDAVPLPGRRDDTVLARADRSDAYRVAVTRGLPETLGAVCGMLGEAKVALVTDETVLALHGKPLVDGLRDAGVAVQVAALPAGEPSKSLEQAGRLWHWLAESSIARRDVLLAFGGGVINDTAGWVASGFMRGIPYVNVPTTLLAQVDGALGGKVAVNHAVAKNLLGAFYQPLGVVSNVEYLRTISDRHLRAGLAEAVKKAIIASPAYWDFIESAADAILDRELAVLERLVQCAAAIKTTLVERDPYEHDLRRPLNFGHTIGHPLETVAGYGAILHGEAVAFGMVVEARIAVNRGLLPEAELARIVELLGRCALPTRASELPRRVDGRAIVAAMEKVRLIRAGSLRYVLPRAMGETVIADDVSEREVIRALAETGLSVGARVARPARAS